MNNEEQLNICRIISKTCFWGQGGIKSILLEDLQKQYPTDPTWQQVSTDNYKKWKYEFIGTITDKEELERLLLREYWLVNYSPGEISVFYPSHHGGGLYKYIVGDWADELGKRYDRHNFGVYQRRAEKQEAMK